MRNETTSVVANHTRLRLSAFETKKPDGSSTIIFHIHRKFGEAKMAAITASVDPLLACPYNTSHQVRKSRMQYHLTKCRNNYPSMGLVICPFNAAHHVEDPEYVYHLSVCPDKRILEEYRYVTMDEERVTEGPPRSSPRIPDDDENWDGDLVNASYDASALAANRKVLRTIQGATKSQRKQFRLQERVRVRALREQEGGEDGDSGPAAAAPRAPASVPAPQPTSELRPLRPPRSLPPGLSGAAGRGRLPYPGCPLPPPRRTGGETENIIRILAGRGRGFSDGDYREE